MKKTSSLTLLVLGLFSLVLVGCSAAPTMTEVSGAITNVEQWKDGLQLTIVTDDDMFYTTAVSMNDTVVNGTLSDLTVGTVVTVSVNEVAWDLLIGDSVEIIN